MDGQQETTGRKWSEGEERTAKKWEADGWNGRKEVERGKKPWNGWWVRERQRWSEERKWRNTELMSEEMMNGLKERQMGRLHQGAVHQRNGRSKWKSDYKVKDDDDYDDDTHARTHTHTHIHTHTHTIILPEAGVILLNRFHIKSKACVMI